MKEQCNCDQALELADLVSKLWRNIENGTTQLNFFSLREQVRKALSEEKC